MKNSLRIMYRTKKKGRVVGKGTCKSLKIHQIREIQFNLNQNSNTSIELDKLIIKWNRKCTIKRVMRKT